MFNQSKAKSNLTLIRKFKTEFSIIVQPPYDLSGYFNGSNCVAICKHKVAISSSVPFSERRGCEHAKSVDKDFNDL